MVLDDEMQETTSPPINWQGTMSDSWFSHSEPHLLASFTAAALGRGWRGGAGRDLTPGAGRDLTPGAVTHVTHVTHVTPGLEASAL